MKRALVGLLSLVGFSSFGATYTCYEYKIHNLGTVEEPDLSRTVLWKQVQRGETLVPLYANIIALNEGVDDFLNTLRDGERICLKGEYAAVSGRRIFAYEARRE